MIREHNERIKAKTPMKKKPGINFDCDQSKFLKESPENQNKQNKEPIIKMRNYVIGEPVSKSQQVPAPTHQSVDETNTTISTNVSTIQSENKPIIKKKTTVARSPKFATSK